MSYVNKNSRKVFASIAGVILVTAVGAWQFYQFVTFRNEQGIPELEGGRVHLWWAIAMAILACVATFFVFSVFMRHDTDDELHIT
jgi:polyferredoxin